MDPDEMMDFLRAQQANLHASQVRFEEDIAKIRAVLREVAALQERTKQILQR